MGHIHMYILDRWCNLLYTSTFFTSELFFEKKKKKVEKEIVPFVNGKCSIQYC